MQTQAQSIRCWSHSLRWRAVRSVVAGKRVGVVLLAGTLFAGALLSACTMPPDVRANYDQGVNFAQYRTYGFWGDIGTDANGYETLTTQQLKAATRREMDARGYTYSAHDADLLVNFAAKVEQRVRVSPGGYYGYPYGYGWYGGGYGYGGWGMWGAWQPYVDQYDEGTLNIDIVDARRKQLVWEGTAVGRISDKMRDNQAQAISDTVREIFMKYPFRAGGG